ncbi:hypothetical protein EBR21_16325, partial [bacterium]|nr:hypothetical protein [bacterium]
MRSTDDSRAKGRLFLVATTTLMCLFNAAAFPAGKAKPDLPIGEELEEAASSKSTAAKSRVGKSAAATKRVEEKDPHASAPAQH